MSRKVLAVASGGGHWIEFLRLSQAFEGLNLAFATLCSGYAADVPGKRFQTVHDFTRWDLGKLIANAILFVRIVLIERPDAVVTTGSAPGLMTIALARLLVGAKAIWIGRIANCERMSDSGPQARRVADVWLTRWLQLHEQEDRQYWGSVL